MRKSLLATIAGAALIAGGGLAAAQQRMEGSPGGANGAQGSSQREPRGGVHERQSGAMQGQAQGQSTAIGEEGQRSGHSGTMQGQAQGRSGAIGENERRTRHSGTMQGQAQGRSGAIGENEHRTRHSGATPDPGAVRRHRGKRASLRPVRRDAEAQAQGRSGAVKEKNIAPASPARCKARLRGGPARSRTASAAPASAVNDGWPDPAGDLAPCKVRPRSGPDDRSGPPLCRRIKRPDFTGSSPAGTFAGSTMPISRLRSGPACPIPRRFMTFPKRLWTSFRNIAASST